MTSFLFFSQSHHTLWNNYNQPMCFLMETFRLFDFGSEDLSGILNDFSTRSKTVKFSDTVWLKVTKNCFEYFHVILNCSCYKTKMNHLLRFLLISIVIISLFSKSDGGIRISRRKLRLLKKLAVILLLGQNKKIYTFPFPLPLPLP